MKGSLSDYTMRPAALLKKCNLLMLSLFLFTPFVQAQYCTSGASSVLDGDIGNVVINGVTHVSTCATTGGSGSTLNLYSDFTGLGSITTFYPGDIINFQVQVITCNGSFNNGIGIYVDYNRNGQLTDPGELVYVTPNNTMMVMAGGQFTGAFTVPNGITMGNTLMRIVVEEGASGTNIQPCGTYLWGETEDYTVTLGSPITANISHASCGSNDGQIDITYTGGTAPYTYAWSNGATTEDLLNLSPGAYSVIITDANGITAQSTFYVNASNLNLNASTFTPSCFANDGYIYLNPSGGTAPYQILWSNGSTNDSLLNLYSGGYSVDVTDANGCFVHEVYDLAVSTNCYVALSGSAFYDINNNCVQDAGETGIPYATITLNNSNNNGINGAITPDSTGMFTAIADTGNYIVHANLPSSYMSINCAGGNNIAVALPNYGMSQSGVSFPVSIPTIQDLKVNLVENNYVPGFSHYANISYRNAGTIATNAILTYNYSGVLQNISFSVPPTTHDVVNHIVTWNLGILPMLSLWEQIHIIGIVDSTATIGTPAPSSASIDPIASDYTPADNVDNLSHNVVAAFDPNIKQVSPEGVTEFGLVEANTNEFHYTVHFQNTGNYPAQFVIVKDSIPAELDITTLVFEGSSHPCTVSIQNDRLLVFRFDNIQLPDSASNEPASHGFVSFALNTHSNVPPFTSLYNKAGIIFDFNTPVITNEVVNTLYVFPQIALGNAITVCETDEVQASVNGGKAPYSFTWSNGNVQSGNQTGASGQIANTLPTGANTLVVTDAYGYEISQGFQLQTVALAVATFTQNVLSGNTYQFMATVTNYPSYLWDLGNGQSSTIYNPVMTYPNVGAYNVTLQVQNQCGVVTETQTIDITTDMESAAFEANVRTYPNPFTQTLAIDFPNPSNIAFTFVVSDIQGKVIASVESSDNHIVIDTDKWASGMYIWSLKGAHAASGKIEKK